MQFEESHWRLVHTPPAPGAWNMAVDEAILDAVGGGESLPTLRLFAWDPPCLSLGYAQPVADVDQGRLAEYGWQLVRRPTGGRAILHTDELTYSVITPLHEPRVAGSVLESYSRLSKALLSALQILSLPAQARESYGSPTGRNTNPICFEVPSNYEITVDGKKLIGSAQARRKEGVLQHGSLPLHGDLSRIVDVLNPGSGISKSEAATRLLEHATTVETVLNRPITWNQAAEAFRLAFEQSLNLIFDPGELTAAETNRTQELVAEKYGVDTWNKRV